MIAAETAACLICGLITGLVLGLPLHYALYQKMITSRWGDVWKFPVSEICIMPL